MTTIRGSSLHLSRASLVRAPLEFADATMSGYLEAGSRMRAWVKVAICCGCSKPGAVVWNERRATPVDVVCTPLLRHPVAVAR
jgi:hypothetical protein